MRFFQPLFDLVDIFWDATLTLSFLKGQPHFSYGFHSKRSLYLPTLYVERQFLIVVHFCVPISEILAYFCMLFHTPEFHGEQISVQNILLFY